MLVTDPTGTPLPGVSLVLAGGRPNRCSTDATGRCMFSGLAPGEFTIRATAMAGQSPDAAGPQPLIVPVKAQELVGAWLVWPREPTSLEVQVLDAHGSAPGPFDVSVWILPGSPRFAQVFSEGKVSRPFYQAFSGRPLENLPPGRYTLYSPSRSMQECAAGTVVLQAGSHEKLTLRRREGSCP